MLELLKLWVKVGIECDCKRHYTVHNAGSDVSVSVFNV